MNYVRDCLIPLIVVATTVIVYLTEENEANAYVSINYLVQVNGFIY